MDPHPTTRVLLTILDNQKQRIEAALEGLDEATYEAQPGGDCASIQAIGQHVVKLQRFQLTILGSPLASTVADAEAVTSLPELLTALRGGMEHLRQAIAEHDPDDWFAVPASPRPGPWGDEPTLARFVRPLNDLTNHLGAIRAIRRMHGCPAPRTQ